MKRRLLCFSLVMGCLLLGACASGNRPLQLLGGAGPVYPPAAKTAGVEGFVTLRYDVNVEGVVTNISVVASEPEGVFDDAAITALASWKFNPARRDGTAMASPNRESTITFRLSGGSDYDRY